MTSPSDEEILHNLEWVDSKDLRDWLQYLTENRMDNMWDRVSRLVNQLRFKECKCGYRTPGSTFQSKVDINMDRHLIECFYREPEVKYWPKKRSDPYP